MKGILSCPFGAGIVWDAARQQVRQPKCGKESQAKHVNELYKLEIQAISRGVSDSREMESYCLKWQAVESVRIVVAQLPS